MVGLDIRAAGSSCQVTNRGETGESYLFSFTDLYSEAVAEEWFGGKSDGKQDGMALTHMAHAVKRLRENTAHLAMPVSDQSGIHGTGRQRCVHPVCTGQSRKRKFFLKDCSKVLQQSEAFLQKQVLQHYVGGVTTSHPEELVPFGSAGSGYRAGTCADAAILGGDAHFWTVWSMACVEFSDPVKWGREIMGGYYSVLLRVLKQYLNVTPVEALAMPFDVDRHYALMQEAVPGITDGIVTEELQRGYLFIRAASAGG